MPLVNGHSTNKCIYYIPSFDDYSRSSEKVDPMALYINMKVLENDDGSGVLELWKRGSITCTHILGTLKYDNRDERDVLLDMLMKGHPEVSFMEKDIPTGCFVDNYYKWPQRGPLPR